MRALLVSASLFVVMAAVPHAQQPAEPTQLPVRRVVLYKSGVGYFEHRGAVTGSADIAVQFTSGQLNDVLKSLTAIDLNDGRISSIGYNSVAPIEQRLQALRLPLGVQPGLLQFYNALRGARVEIRGGGVSVTGRVVSIEQRGAREDDSEPIDLTVITADGSLRTVTLGRDVTVRIAEDGLRDEIARYLSVVASGRDQDVRRMILSATGEGTRQLLVSYISEVPIWKSTYRLVMPDSEDDRPLLQGWAIVDNTVGEDWTNVELSLVAGAPQSFVQQLSQPHYARRPVVPVAGALLTRPQTHDATIEARRELGRGVPGGVVGGVVGGLPAAATPPIDQIVDRSQRIDAVAVAAAAQDLGDLFEYRLTQPVTIRTNQSALVPILSGRVEAARVSLWNRKPGSGRPLRAVWLTNATGLTLDGGTLSVIDAGVFGGEGLMDPLKAGERRLVSYGTDLGVTMDARLEGSSGRYTRVVARDGVILATQEERSRWVYRARNEDSSAREIVVEHAIPQGWSLSTDPAPVETTAAGARFVLPVAARGEATLAITERRIGETRVTIDQVDDRLLVSVSERGIPLAELQRAMAPVMSARVELAAAERQLTELGEQLGAIAEDQARLRENIRALGSSRGERALVERYTRELSAQEDRLEELRDQLARVTAERNARRAALSSLVSTLSFEISAN